MSKLPPGMARAKSPVALFSMTGAVLTVAARASGGCDRCDKHHDDKKCF